MEGEHTTNNDCIIDERLNIHIPGELWEQLGNPQWVEVDAENGLPEYFSIRIAACPKETPVGSDGLHPLGRNLCGGMPPVCRDAVYSRCFRDGEKISPFKLGTALLYALRRH